MAVIDVIQQVIFSPSLLLLVTAASLLFFAIIHTLFIRRLHPHAPPEANDNLPISGAFGFWTSRWAWMKRQHDQSKTGNFSFHAGPNTIVALSGDKGRQLFFDSKDLGLAEGYAVLFGQAPQVNAHDDGEGKEDDTEKFFVKRLHYLLKNDQFRRKLPSLISDVQDCIDAISADPSGITDPFDSLYRVVFRLTIRMLGAEEMADDPKLMSETLKLFEMIDNSATATSVMFPKFPSPAILKRTYAGARLYFLVENIIKKRAETDEKRHDALQYMLDQGDRTFKVVEFIVGALFAGQLNSGINAAWVMCYLATSPEWMAKTLKEVRDTAAKYARDTNAPLRRQLDDVPLEAWEAEFPIVDMCLRDSIRLNSVGCAMRRNVSGKAIPTGVGDEVIPPGAFVTYATGDVHLDTEVFRDPYKWDPARYLPDRAEDKKKSIHPFIGWGSGRHPCLGMRFAKLEQNIITAYFIASFEFKLQDKNGRTLTAAPPIDFNGHSAHKPKVKQYLKVTPRNI